MIILLLNIFLNSTFAKTNVIFTSGDFPPYVSTKMKDHGIYTQIVKEVFNKSGYNISFQIQPWNRAFDEVKGNSKNASFPWLKTEQREKEVLYPKTPIGLFKEVLIYKKEKFPNGLEAKSLEELVKKKVRIIAIQSYWYTSKLSELNADIIYAPTPSSAYAMLMADRGDVHINTDKVVEMELKEFFTNESERNRLTSSKNPIHISPAFIIFAKDNPESKKLIDHWDKNAKEILEKHHSP